MKFGIGRWALRQGLSMNNMSKIRGENMGLLKKLFSNSTKEIPPICNVDIKRYLGKWYEIARLPHSFEKGLENVTAEYSLRDDRKVDVTNSGYKNGKLKIAKGIARIKDQACTGELMVSFFLNIEARYKIIHLDKEDYQYAVVTSSTKNYLWILCRKPRMDEKLYNELISYVESQGFDIVKLIKVVHN